jgi:integrase
MRTGKLTALAVTQATRKGYYNDGGGLYLRIAEGGSKGWVFRFRVPRAVADIEARTANVMTPRAKAAARLRLREMGLGSIETLSLKEARERARECRKLRLDGIDPIEQRKAVKSAKALEAARTMTFRECAEAYIAAHRDDWKNTKHAAQWPSTLAAYVYPVFGELPVQTVDTDVVMKALLPIWSTKRETASRVRGRIESILDWATVSKFRQGENAARWTGHLEELLSKSKPSVKHHAALPYDEIGAFMARLRDEEAIAARGLEFAVLTAARTGEVIGALWSEIDQRRRLWTIPPERMKGGKRHRVPLCDGAMAIIEKMAAIRESEFVFPGAKPGRPLSNMAFLMLLRRMGRSDLTAHGFRSTLRDWAAERTNFPHEVAEMALAHKVSDKVEAAYRRGDLFEKRRQFAQAWERFCAAPKMEAPSRTEKVVAIGAAR